MKNKLFAASMAILGLLSLASCNSDGGNESTSELIGKFSSNNDRSVILSNDESKKGISETRNGINYTYIYTSDLYPLNTVEDEDLNYNTSQSLRLKRDYTYEYTCDILLRKVTTNGNTDLAKVSFTSKGTFEYVELDDSVFHVTLSDPIEGKEERFGSYISEEGKNGNVYSWSLSSTASYSLDLSMAAKVEDYEFDRYVKGRSVTVTRASERVLEDDVFFDDFLSDVAPYCSYDPDADSNTDVTPVVPDEKKYESGHLDLPFVEYSDGISVGLRVGENLSLVAKTSSSIPSLPINGDAIRPIESKDGYNVFVVPMGFDVLKDSITISDFEFMAKDYLLGLSSLDEIVLDNKSTDEEIGNVALQSTVASLLYAIDLKADETYLLDEERTAVTGLIYSSSDENVYHKSNWELREMTCDNSSDWKCEWKDASLGGLGLLDFTFESKDGPIDGLSIHAQVEGRKPYEIIPMVSSSTDGKTIYSFATNQISPLDYDLPISLGIYVNDKQIGGDAVYSVTRSAAKADLSEDEVDKKLAMACYSLGKSSTWYANKDDVSYEFKTPINSDGYYRLEIDEYTYDDDRMTVSKVDYDTFGTALYIGGQVLSDRSEDGEVSGEHYIAVKADASHFNVNLGGATIDGIRATDGSDNVVRMILNGNSKISRSLVPEWGDAYPSSSIKTFGSLRIGGKKGSVLDVYGGIYVTKNLVVSDGVIVNVHCLEDDVDAVTCASLQLGKDASLNIVKTKVNSRNVSSSALNVSSGDVVVDGNLSCSGFAYGAYLGGDEGQCLTVESGGLNIVAVNEGITGSSVSSNRPMSFLGGASSIRAATGIRYGDVTLDDASLTVIADGGYTIKADNAFTLKTNSGDPTKGKLNLINNYYNPWWDDSYVVKAKEISLDGGSIYMFGMSKNGVIVTDTGANVTVGNSDLTIENGQGTKTQAIGMRLEGGDEKVIFSNKAKVMFKNCSTAVSCYSKDASATSYAVVENHGVIIQDTYRCAIVPWSSSDNNDIASWEMLLTFTNDGIVKTTNYVKEVE